MWHLFARAPARFNRQSVMDERQSVTRASALCNHFACCARPPGACTINELHTANRRCHAPSVRPGTTRRDATTRLPVLSGAKSTNTAKRTSPSQWTSTGDTCTCPTECTYAADGTNRRCYSKTTYNTCLCGRNRILCSRLIEMLLESEYVCAVWFAALEMESRKLILIECDEFAFECYRFISTHTYIGTYFS